MWIAAQLVLPEPVRYDHRIVLEVGVFPRLIQSAEIWADAEHGEEIFRRGRAVHQPRLTVSGPGEGKTRQVLRDVGKGPVLLEIVQEIRSRGGDSILSDGIGAAPDRIKPLRMGIRQWPN